MSHQTFITADEKEFMTAGNKPFKEVYYLYFCFYQVRLTSINLFSKIKLSSLNGSNVQN